MKEKGKDERSNNNIIKGIELEEEEKIDREWVEDFIEKVTDAIVRVTKCRISSKVIIATLEEQEIKSVVMRRKSRLKGGKVFIENEAEAWKFINKRRGREEERNNNISREEFLGLDKLKIV